MTELARSNEATQPTSASPRALEELAQFCGILSSFTDARGQVRETSSATRARLLAAMKITASADNASEALSRLKAAEEARALPPVYVHTTTAGPLEIEVAGVADSAWSLELEDGSVRRGQLLDMPTQRGRNNARVTITEPLPWGYHRLTLEGHDCACALIVTPGCCWLPTSVAAGARLWGVAAQLYLVRSRANWGIGDFGDLFQLVRGVAARGADMVGLNPLHALFPDDPEHASPYSPASRLLLNVLNIDLARVTAEMDCPNAQARMRSSSFQEALAQAQSAHRIDYSAVAALKLPLLRELFECCDRSGADWRAFLQYRAAAGESFERSCLFLALRAHFASSVPARADWHEWPDEYRRPDSPGTLQFADDEANQVTYQAWLQFIADRQLAACREAASGMAVGLYRDVAVGAALGGAETWANPEAVIDSVHVGAPPDIYNPAGQDWGLPAFYPRALRAEGYRSFIELLRANMRHAGGLRIDHVMGLQQLYWIPQGQPPSAGAYVSYPLEDLLGILALESHRHRCLVVGEDLGTVPVGFRERMAAAHILSYRVLFFEKDASDFIPPQNYPQLALAVSGSHDLPTLRAWWEGEDLALKRRLRLYPNEALERQSSDERRSDRAAFSLLLKRLGLIDKPEINAAQFVEAAHRLLARTASAFALVQLDDLTGEIEPVNVPTTRDEYPNWRRRLSIELDDHGTIVVFERDARPQSSLIVGSQARSSASLRARPRGDRSPGPLRLNSGVQRRAHDPPSEDSDRDSRHRGGKTRATVRAFTIVWRDVRMQPIRVAVTIAESRWSDAPADAATQQPVFV